jgi:hypothetical protein
MALEPVTGSAVGLVESCCPAEVGRTLRRHRDVIGADDLRRELLGQCGHLRAWPFVLDAGDKLLRLVE